MQPDEASQSYKPMTLTLFSLVAAAFNLVILPILRVTANLKAYLHPDITVTNHSKLDGKTQLQMPHQGLRACNYARCLAMIYHVPMSRSFTSFNI